MEIKVGDYVRTPNGVITKIIDIQDEEGQYFINNNAVSLKTKTYIADKNITIGENFKHSPNIIDLIEEGDYVNGEKIVNLGKDRNDKKIIYYYIPSDYGEDYFEENEIKSIVAKEQFSQMEYKIER